MITKELLSSNQELFDDMLIVEAPQSPRIVAGLKTSATEYRQCLPGLRAVKNMHKLDMFRTKALVRERLAESKNFAVFDNNIRDALQEGLKDARGGLTWRAQHFLAHLTNADEEELMIDLLVVNDYCATGVWHVNGGDLAEQQVHQRQEQAIKRTLGEVAAGAIK